LKGITFAVIICSLSIVLAGAACAGSSTQWVDITSGFQTVSLNQYNDADPLEKVIFEVQGTFNGTIRVENTAAAPQDITATLNGNYTLTKNSVDVVSCIASFSKVYNCTAFDGSVDWGGTSGFSDNISKSASNTTTYTAGVDDLSEYIGSGAFDVTVLRQVLATATGSNDMDAWCSAAAVGKVGVTYVFAPEPGSIATLLTGCVGLVGFGLRRRAK
jgi:hypothetical protein